MDLKSSDECQVVELIRGNVCCKDMLTHDYGESIVKEEKGEDNSNTERICEFANNEIGKKLQLTIKIFASNIAAMDNGTLVEAFKFLNYCQLAKNSLVSKRFRDLTRTHRHSLALLCVDSIDMKRGLYGIAYINVFDKYLSPEAYNEWVICNNSNRRRWQDRTTVFHACAKLNHENLPLFQHFARLITDPFVYIRWMDLIPQNEVFNLLAGAVHSEHDRIQCEQLRFKFKGNVQKFMSWIKNHVRCGVFHIDNDRDMTVCDEKLLQVLLDFILTGARCTSKIKLQFCERSRVIVELAQKFLDLKRCDEYQFVESIECNVGKMFVEELRRQCGKFVVKEEINGGNSEHVFEFVNIDIGKKMQLTTQFSEYGDVAILDLFDSYFDLKFNNL
ncbi:hypothetical protein Ddc_18474 [Ditylenchus destructor]|nr:hypothetical protein Ddc_18474 [Ditylenchus destructor]